MYRLGGNMKTNKSSFIAGQIMRDYKDKRHFEKYVETMKKLKERKKDTNNGGINGELKNRVY
jgi:hypothetical protein